ncbi:MAG: type I-E CRISPR-associated protein Cas5/CasD [Gammaproteobacteria bacterium]|nr:type I-E CRISPR-associated protein Cas5/CasD [Gammaproteobacteria bacterium]MCP5426085.1 type I-E CRISPR-associated protein Cas5/CasD [Gammaproteobacteria bacterium]
MPQFLILRLDGLMQAWGGHTFEDFRPSHLFPTRSGLLGLLGACLGLDRHDQEGQRGLAESVEFTVRADSCVPRPERIEPSTSNKRAVKLPDFHTVLGARKVDGSINKNPVVSRREYLFDAAFTVAVEGRSGASFGLEEIANAVQKPVYTPFLGRRSCPLARPLFGGIVEAEEAKAALAQVSLGAGVIYGEGESMRNNRPLQIRDVPLHGPHRQFGARWTYVHSDQGGQSDVSESL